MRMQQRQTPMRQMIPLNNTIKLRALGQARSMETRQNLMLVFNVCRILFVVVLMFCSPTFLGKQIALKGNIPELVLIVGLIYIVVMGLLTLYALKDEVSSVIILANAIAEALILQLFFWQLQPELNWDFLSVSYVTTLLLSILTLSFRQSIVFSFVTYLSLLFLVGLWRVTHDTAAGNPISLGHKLTIFYQNSLENMQLFQTTSILSSAIFILVIMVGYLATQARENKIQAWIQTISANQLHELNDTVFSEMQTALVVVNLVGEIISMNHQARLLFDLPSEMPPPTQLQSLSSELIQRQARWERIKENDHTPFQIKGVDYSVEFSFVRMKTYAPLIMLSFEDMRHSFQKVRENRLAVLGRLTASIAHEIRNPLGSVLSANELIKEQTQDTMILYLAEKITNNGQRMNVIIDNILSMFSQKTATMQLIKLNQFIHEVIEDASSYDALESIPIRTDMSAAAAYSIYFDREHLRQILHNLMLNAVAHSGRQDVEITLKAHFATSGHFLYLDICDNGLGIAEDDQDRIFEPFFSKQQGTGLGLFLVREMCLANQAKIEYVDREEGGACFRITMERYQLIESSASGG